MPGQDHAPGSDVYGNPDPWVQGQIDWAKKHQSNSNTNENSDYNTDDSSSDADYDSSSDYSEDSQGDYNSEDY